MALALLGVGCAVIAYILVEAHSYNPLILVPAVVTATIGFLNITKLEAPRD